MSRTRFILLAGAAVAAGIAAALVAAAALQLHFRKAPAMRASWVHAYEALPQMVRDADAVVLGTVGAIRPGRTMATSGGNALLPFTLVDIQVELVVRGQSGGLVTVEQTGGQANDRIFHIDGDGGPYEAGERVLLFLKRQTGTGYYYLANPQGRFSVENGRLQAVTPNDAVSQRLDLRPVEQAVRLIRGGG